MITSAGRRARLVSRHHLDRTAESVEAATRDLVALHSSDPLTPHLALWARVPDYHVEDLDAAIADNRSLWRLHAMRRTLWVAPDQDVGILHAAAGNDVARKERKRLIGFVAEGRSDAEAWLDSLEPLVLDAVGSQPGITTRELTSEVPELATRVVLGSGKWSTEVAIGSRLLYLMAMELKVIRTAPSGSWKSSQYGWALPESIQALEAPRARARLVARYLERFGPVTATDVRWWTGFTAARVRRALEDAGAVAVEVEGSGEAWIAPTDPIAAELNKAQLDAGRLEAPAAGEPAGSVSGENVDAVALLPGLDPTPMGYKERDWFLGAHESHLFDRNGNVGPTVWLNGRIVGGWAVRDDGSVRVRFLEDVGPDAERLVEAEAEALTAWLDGVSITPRFRTPLERELAG